MRSICKKCGRRYRILAKNDLCAFCYKDETGEWASMFTSSDDSLRDMKLGKGGKKKKK